MKQKPSFLYFRESKNLAEMKIIDYTDVTNNHKMFFLLVNQNFHVNEYWFVSQLKRL